MKKTLCILQLKLKLMTLTCVASEYGVFEDVGTAIERKTEDEVHPAGPAAELLVTRGRLILCWVVRDRCILTAEFELSSKSVRERRMETAKTVSVDLAAVALEFYTDFLSRLMHLSSSSSSFLFDDDVLIKLSMIGEYVCCNSLLFFLLLFLSVFFFVCSLSFLLVAFALRYAGLDQGPPQDRSPLAYGGHSGTD